MAAERDTVDRLIAAYLAEQINSTFEARISGVTKVGAVCPIAAVRRRRLHSGFNSRRRLLSVRRSGPRAVRRAHRQGLSARRPRRGAPRRSRAAGRRDALRDAERAETPAGVEAVVPQVEGPRDREPAPRSRAAAAGDDDGRQQVFGGEHHSGRPARPLWQAMWSGFRGKCPHCGEGQAVLVLPARRSTAATHCGEEMHHHRADDLPAYLVIVIVGHIVVGAFMGVEATSTLSTWQHLAIWVPLTIVLRAGAAAGRSRARSSACNGRSTCTASAATPDRIETHPEL